MREHRARGRRAPLPALLLLALACSDTSNLAPPAATPAATGKADFAEVKARIHELLERGVPSMAVAVVKDGSILWEEGFGLADLATRQAATPHTRYPIGSISKPFTATAVMILAERGEVDLTAPANRYLGQARLSRPDGDPDQVTVRDLLQHRAGLPSPHLTRYYDGEKREPIALEETIRRYGVVVDPPGQRFAYSNLGYGILAQIVSRASGLEFADFMAREVFSPLGLTDTTLDMGATPDRPGATLYQKKRALPGYRFDEAGSQQIWSSAHDLARFALFHLGEPLPDQRPVLSEKSRLAMASDARPSGRPGGAWGPEWFYALGWGGRNQGGHNDHRWYGHDGGLPGAVGDLRLIPGERLAVAVLANEEGAPTKEVLELILDAVLPGHAWARREDAARRQRPAAEPFSAPAQLVGAWEGEIRTWSDSIGVRLDIGPSGARVRIGGGADVALDALEMFEGRLRGRSPGRLPAPDLADLPYELWYELRLEREQLLGAAYAADLAPLRHFVLASWMHLHRVKR